ncbi:hypothetical protein LEMLEM_LOCUS9968, partial [Lemmus lemmus]
ARLPARPRAALLVLPKGWDPRASSALPSTTAGRRRRPRNNQKQQLVPPTCPRSNLRRTQARTQSGAISPTE